MSWEVQHLTVKGQSATVSGLHDTVFWRAAPDTMCVLCNDLVQGFYKASTTLRKVFDAV